MAASYWIQINEPGHPPRVSKVDHETEFGRDCDGEVLDDPTVSRRHLKLDPTAVGLVIEDLGSANGTYVDGERVTEPLILQVGHVIGAGETEITVHSAHETESTHDGESGAEMHADPTMRVSEEARRLSSAANKSVRGKDRPF